MIPEMEVARARPLNFIGYIRTELRIIFIAKANAVILVGVTVSLSAKNPQLNMRVAP